jgi:Glycosyltransferase family 9 (heptosyltransferase)
MDCCLTPIRIGALCEHHKLSPVVVRLEGGIGDHVLGMRVLPFVRNRFPEHPLALLSDCGGHLVQASVAAMSPLADQVVVGLSRAAIHEIDAMGRLENLDDNALSFVKQAHAFVDTWGNRFFLDASRLLQTPFCEILAARPLLVPPSESEKAAARLLEPHAGKVLVTMNLSKFGAGWLMQHWEKILAPLLSGILADSRVVVFNLFTTRFTFSQFPKEIADLRDALLQEEALFMGLVEKTHERIFSLANLDIGTVVALLRRSAYFIGVDNGVKHLAWALDVPHTFLNPTLPDDFTVLRWMPDLHRLLPTSASRDELSSHARDALDAVARAKPIG